MPNPQRKHRAGAVKVMFTSLVTALMLSIGLVWGIQPADAKPVRLSSQAEFSQLATPTLVSPELKGAAEALEQVMINIFERVDPSVVSIEVVFDQTNEDIDSSGTGYVYDKNGYIITNAHVVQGAREVIITFNSGLVTKAEIVGTDDYGDIAVLKAEVDETELYPVVFGDSRQLRIGQTVLTIGNPFGLNHSYTIGIVSGMGRILNSARMMSPFTNTPFQNPAIIQIDATINPGNSGGPLLNLNGEVVGMNTAIRSETGRFQGIGFAVPSNTIKRIVPQLIEKGKAEYPWLGVESIGLQVNSRGTISVAALAEQFDLPVNYGVMIGRILPDSPAEKAGLRGGTRRVTFRDTQIQLGGDIIVAIDGTPIRDFDQLLAYLVSETSPGDTINVEVYRGREIKTIEVTLEARPVIE